MEIDRRALYNSLRMNWQLDPNLDVEPWQVEDYRALSLDNLFERLALHEINLNRSAFQALAEDFDSPEELTDSFLEDFSPDATTQDQVYLLIFELWRRLLPEKPCLSIFCDELDYQIHLYDTGEAESTEGIQDALSNLQVILEENIDQGIDPLQAFESVGAGCANDLESFLYDFISDQIESENLSYALELLEAFYEYVKEAKWFDFLRAKALSYTDPQASDSMTSKLVKVAQREKDLDFNLQILSFMVQGGEKNTFISLAKQSIPLLKEEEDLQDLLCICADFYHRLDHDGQEQAIQKIMKIRKNYPPEKPVNEKDSDISQFLKILVAK